MPMVSRFSIMLHITEYLNSVSRNTWTLLVRINSRF
jgi:hypothetical protein